MRLWKFLLVFFFVLAVFDGALRKWVLPSLSTLIYLLKDGVLLGAVVAYGTSRSVKLPAPVRQTWLPAVLVAYGFWVLLEACHLNVPSFYVAALGIRSHLLYLSLLVLVPAALNGMRRPGRFVAWGCVFIIIPVLLLGAYQFYQPSTHWINRYVATSVNITAVGGRPRITGTFPYIAGMGMFCMFAFTVGFGMVAAGLSGRRKWLTALGILLLGLSAVVGPMTGSRSVVLIPAATSPIVFGLVFRKRQLRGRLTATLGVLAIVVVLLVQTTGLSGGWNGVMHRFEGGGAGATQNRVSSMFVGPLERIGSAGWIGYGTGTMHQAAKGLTGLPSSSWTPEVSYEGESERVLLGVGLIGLILYLSMKFCVTLLAFQALWRAEDSFEIGASATAFFYLLTKSVTGFVIYDAAAGAVYWGMAGLAVTIWSWQKAQSVAGRHPSCKPALSQRSRTSS